MSVYQRGELKYLGNGTLYSLGKALSKFYLIPNEKSHGFNREILLEYAKENSKYHRVPAIACSQRVGFKTQYDVVELLEIIEKILKEKRLPATGFDFWTLPDRTFLINYYFHICDQEDAKQIENKQFKMEDTVERVLDPRVVEELKQQNWNVAPKKNMFTLSLVERAQIKKKKIQNKIKKKNKQQEYLTKFGLVLQDEKLKLWQKLPQVDNNQIGEDQD